MKGEERPLRLNLTPEMVQGRSLAKAEVKAVSFQNKDNYPGQSVNLERDAIIIKPLQAVLLRFA